MIAYLPDAEYLRADFLLMLARTKILPAKRRKRIIAKISGRTATDKGPGAVC